MHRENWLVTHRELGGTTWANLVASPVAHRGGNQQKQNLALGRRNKAWDLSANTAVHPEQPLGRGRVSLAWPCLCKEVPGARVKMKMRKQRGRSRTACGRVCDEEGWQWLFCHCPGPVLPALSTGCVCWLSVLALTSCFGQVSPRVHKSATM